MESAHNHLPVPVTPWVTLRDYAAFQVKLIVRALKTVVLVSLATLAIAVDLIIGRWQHPRLFHGVVRLSRSLDEWLGLHRLRGATLGEEDGSLLEDLITGAPDPDQLVDELERLVRKRLVRDGSSG